MKIGIVTDNHAGCRNDSPVFVEYCISFFEKQFIPYLLENKIDYVIHLGDVFDRRKYVNFNTLFQWRNRVFDVLQKHNIKMDILLGNHDIYYKNTNDINSVYELLRGYTNITIYDKPLTIEVDNLPIFFLPWTPQGGEENTFNAIKETNSDVCMGHLEIKGFEMHAGQVNREHGFDHNLFDKFDIVLSGHFHHKSNKGNIYYLGAPYQMTWNDWGDIRGFHTFDTQTRELIFIENKRQIFTKLFYNDENKTFQQVMKEKSAITRRNGELINNDDFFEGLKELYVKIIVERKDNPYWYDQFLDKVYASSPADVSIVDQTLQSYSEEEIDSAKDTLTILKEHVSSLGIPQEDDLNLLLSNLYNEALSLDIE